MNQKSSPLKPCSIFSLRLSLFRWNFASILPVYIHTYLPILVLLSSVAPEAFQKWGAQFFTVPPLFVVPPMTGHYRKVQGTVTRTELGQSWPTVRGQSDLWLFKVTLCQRWPRQSIEHRAWMVSYRSYLLTPTPYHAAFPRCCILILKHIFGQFRGTSAHTLAAGSRAPEGIWTRPRLTHGYCCRGCVPKISSIVQAVRPQYTHVPDRQTDRRWQRPHLVIIHITDTNCYIYN